MMGDKINPACLSTDDDRVFVSFDNGILRTAFREFYRRYKDSSYICRLPGQLMGTPRVGQRLRITLWHNGLPVKIEVKQGKVWDTIFEITELPLDMHCLAGCGAESEK